MRPLASGLPGSVIMIRAVAMCSSFVPTITPLQTVRLERRYPDCFGGEHEWSRRRALAAVERSDSDLVVSGFDAQRSHHHGNRPDADTPEEPDAVAAGVVVGTGECRVRRPSDAARDALLLLPVPTPCRESGLSQGNGFSSTILRCYLRTHSPTPMFASNSAKPTQKRHLRAYAEARSDRKAYRSRLRRIDNYSLRADVEAPIRRQPVRAARRPSLYRDHVFPRADVLPLPAGHRDAQPLSALTDPARAIAKHMTVSLGAEPAQPRKSRHCSGSRRGGVVTAHVAWRSATPGATATQYASE